MRAASFEQVLRSAIDAGYVVAFERMLIPLQRTGEAGPIVCSVSSGPDDRTVDVVAGGVNFRAALDAALAKVDSLVGPPAVEWGRASVPQFEDGVEFLEGALATRVGQVADTGSESVVKVIQESSSRRRFVTVPRSSLKPAPHPESDGIAWNAVESYTVDAVVPRKHRTLEDHLEEATRRHLDAEVPR